MQKEIQEKPILEAFSVDDFHPEDAEGIVELFRAVYEDSYPVRLFYNPREITVANREGSAYSIVARTPAGKVVGATHLFRHANLPNMYEWGAGLVLKECRTLGVNQALSEFLHHQFLPTQPHIEEIFGEPVCNHTHLQKACNAFGYVETGIEAALMPAEAYMNEKSAKGRVATLCCFRSCASKPHRIFLPADYEGILRKIYTRMDDQRELCLSAAPVPETSSTEAESQIFESAGVSRLTFFSAGRDFAARLTDLENSARKKKAVVFQSYVNLTQPWAGQIASILRQRGYFFGGLLPRWFDGDGLLMQKLHCPPDFDGIVLFSEFSKELLHYIRGDRDRAREDFETKEALTDMEELTATISPEHLGGNREARNDGK